MQFQLIFSVDDAEFQDGPDQFDGGAIADVIRDIASQVEVDPSPNQVIRVRTVNGHRVGYAVISEDGVVH